MSAAELLRHFKSLPAGERKKFLRAVLASKRRTVRGQRPSRRVQWPDVEARAVRITGGRVLPNLVLVEREDSAF